MTSENDEEQAEIGSKVKGATCTDCDQSWDGSASKELGEQHAARYDHRVRYYREIVFTGAKDGE
jgi:hypothetical protein